MYLFSGEDGVALGGALAAEAAGQPLPPRGQVALGTQVAPLQRGLVQSTLVRGGQGPMVGT